MKRLKKCIFFYTSLLVIISFITVFVNGTLPIVLKNIIDSLTDKKFENIDFYFLIYVILVVAVMLSEFLNKLLNSLYTKKLYVLLRNLFVNGILEEKKLENPQELYSIYNNEINSLVEDYYLLIPFTIFQVCSVIFYMFLLIKLNFLVSIFVLALNIITVLIPYMFEGKISSYREKSMFSLRKLNTIFYDIVDGIKTIKLYGIKEDIYNNMSEKSVEEQKYFFKYNFLSGVLECMIGVVQFTLSFLIVFFMARNIIKGSSTVGEFIAIVQISDLMVSPIIMLSRNLITIFSIRGIKTNIFKIFKPVNFENQSKVDINSIKFENVSFSYEDNDKTILDNFNFEFEKNKKYLIIGNNGTGKSTIIKLIFGILDLVNGDIKVNGKSIKTDKNIVNNISYVQQKDYIFNDTVNANITLFKDIKENEIIDVLNKVNLDKKLLDNRNKDLNEMNLTISGGEKQKILIARAFLMKNNFLIFDEAFSNIDVKSSQLIENSILEDENLTFINISHNYTEENRKKYDYILNFTSEKIEIIKQS